MRTAVDSSVLMAVFKGEPQGAKWLDLLIRQAALGELVICEVVAAEVSTLFRTASDLTKKLDALGIGLSPSTLSTAFLAGETFLAYRDAGGPREHLIPDFLIAAHAVECADALMAADRGYIRHYFKKLHLIELS